MDNTTFSSDIGEERAEKLDEIKRGNALSRLMGNKDFKYLILDHLLTKEPARLIGLKHSDIASENPKTREKIELKLILIGELGRHFNAVQNLASSAKEYISELDSLNLDEGN